MAARRPKVTGIGGLFFKSRDPAVLGSWYANLLGVPVEGWGGAAFRWREHAAPHREAQTVWSPFKADTQYFAPSQASFMVNFRVADLDAMRAWLISEGVEVDPRIEDSEFGRFGWCMDPEGNRIELWQPPRAQAVKQKSGARRKPGAKRGAAVKVKAAKRKPAASRKPATERKAAARKSRARR